jgi:hypothetical protein
MGETFPKPKTFPKYSLHYMQSQLHAEQDPPANNNQKRNLNNKRILNLQTHSQTNSSSKHDPNKNTYQIKIQNQNFKPVSFNNPHPLFQIAPQSQNANNQQNLQFSPSSANNSNTNKYSNSFSSPKSSKNNETRKVVRNNFFKHTEPPITSSEKNLVLNDPGYEKNWNKSSKPNQMKGNYKGTKGTRINRGLKIDKLANLSKEVDFDFDFDNSTPKDSFKNSSNKIQNNSLQQLAHNSRAKSSKPIQPETKKDCEEILHEIEHYQNVKNRSHQVIFYISYFPIDYL